MATDAFMGPKIGAGDVARGTIVDGSTCINSKYGEEAYELKGIIKGSYTQKNKKFKMKHLTSLIIKRCTFFYLLKWSVFYIIIPNKN